MPALCLQSPSSSLREVWEQVLPAKPAPASSRLRSETPLCPSPAWTPTLCPAPHPHVFPQLPLCISRLPALALSSLSTTGPTFLHPDFPPDSSPPSLIGVPGPQTPFPAPSPCCSLRALSWAQPQVCNISTHSPSTLQLTCSRTAPVLPPGTSLQLTLPASQVWTLPPSLTLLPVSPWLPVIETESRPLKTEKVLLEGNSEFSTIDGKAGNLTWG